MIVEFSVAIDIKDDTIDKKQFEKELKEYLDKAYYVAQVEYRGKWGGR